MKYVYKRYLIGRVREDWHGSACESGGVSVSEETYRDRGGGLGVGPTGQGSSSLLQLFSSHRHQGTQVLWGA